MKCTVLFAIIGQANGSPSSMATVDFADEQAATEAADLFRKAAAGRTNATTHALVFPLQKGGDQNDTAGANP